MNLSRLEICSQMSMTNAQTPAEIENPLSVAIVHQDRAGYKWAQELCHRVQDAIGQHVAQVRAWSMQSLGSVDPWCESVEAGSAADLIFVTAQADRNVPLDVGFWFDALLPQRAGRPGALVGLVSIHERNGFRPFHVQEYLRGVAEAGHLDFFLQERLVSTAPDSLWKKKLWNHGPARVAIPQMGKPTQHLRRGSNAHGGRRGCVSRG